VKCHLGIKELAYEYKCELGNPRNLICFQKSSVDVFRKLMSAIFYCIPAYFSMASSRCLPVTTRTFWGDTMRVVMPELSSISISISGFFEPDLTRWMMDHVNRGATVIDVGAHFGYYTLLNSFLVGIDGQVHAFEPTPFTFSVLESNIKGRPNVFANRIACYSSNKKLSLFDYGPRFSGFNTLGKPRMGGLLAQEKIQVKALTLDDYVESKRIKPNFVKIDAESSELEVLVGMQETIGQYHPVIALEVGDLAIEAPPSRRIVQYLINRGYCAFEITNGGMREHRIHEAYSYSNILFVPN